MRLAIVPILLLVVPIAEIATFIAVGGAIGVWWTLLLILVTAIIGTILLRTQGLGLLARIQGEVRAGRVPARELVHGLMLLLAGVLLLTPGFVTDALGFALFVPPLRDAVWTLLRTRVTAQLRTTAATFGTERSTERSRGRDPFGRPTDRAGTIDLDEAEFQRTDPPRSPSEPSPDGPPDRATDGSRTP